MKYIKKILVSVLFAMLILTIYNQNISNAATDYKGGKYRVSAVMQEVGLFPEDMSGEDFVSELQSTIGYIIGFLQVGSGLAILLIIAFTGFNYIFSTPSVKSEIKSKMLPIIIGLVLVFGAVSVTKFLLGVVK